MTRLTVGIHLLDPEQSVEEATLVARLLEAEVDAGPGGQVIVRGWIWPSAPLHVVHITTDN